MDGLKIKRRKKYTFPIYSGDYFVRKGLVKFILKSICQYISNGLIVGDLGCGDQPLRTLIEQKGAKYIGIDIVQNTQNNVDIIASITAIPLPDNYFDVIICTEVLEHVSDTYSAFKELKRLLKEDGIIILTCPFTYPLHEEPYDYVRLTIHQIKKYAKDNGLKIKEIGKIGNEIEVLGTVWDNMWTRFFVSKNILVKLVIVCLRLPINFISLLLSFVLGKFLPKKFYLNNLVILKKIGKNSVL